MCASICEENNRNEALKQNLIVALQVKIGPVTNDVPEENKTSEEAEQEKAAPGQSQPIAAKTKTKTSVASFVPVFRLQMTPG